MKTVWWVQALIFEAQSKIAAWRARHFAAQAEKLFQKAGMPQKVRPFLCLTCIQPERLAQPQKSEGYVVQTMPASEFDAEKLVAELQRGFAIRGYPYTVEVSGVDHGISALPVPSYPAVSEHAPPPRRFSIKRWLRSLGAQGGEPK